MPAGSHPANPKIEGSAYVLRANGQPWEPVVELAFKKVAVGGIFDCLHWVHMFLLAATAVASRGEVFVGDASERELPRCCVHMQWVLF